MTRVEHVLAFFFFFLNKQLSLFFKIVQNTKKIGHVVTGRMTFCGFSVV